MRLRLRGAPEPLRKRSALTRAPAPERPPHTAQAGLAGGMAQSREAGGDEAGRSRRRPPAAAEEEDDDELVVAGSGLTAGSKECLL